MEADHPVAGLSPAQRAVVAAEMERVLNSAAFRGSKRSQEFLRYVVAHAFEHGMEPLKERSIGAEIFGRPADYDTGDDSIVRVKASEVRKRLAQYYSEAGPAHGAVIELPAGSYSPEFRFPIAGGSAPARRRRVWVSAAAVLLLAGVAAPLLYRRPTALDRFWEPVLRSSRPVLICVPHPVVYTGTGNLRQVFEAPAEQRPGAVPLSEIRRDPDHYVAVGDALALAGLTGFFGRAGKETRVRTGTDTSFTDLRNSPAVLIGAYSNQWTMQVGNDLRYVFDRDAGGSIIRDRMDPSARWSNGASAEYAIVSRLFNSRTGEVLITAAGIAHYGTQAAGEFLTNKNYVEQAVRDAPGDWYTRNMQLVLRAEVIGKTPGPPQTAARWFW